MFEVTVEEGFSAVHYLKLYDGSWEPRHGHLFKVAVTIRSEGLDSMGVVADFEVVKPALKKILSEFNETSFNDHPDFKGKMNPSTENIAKAICERMRKTFHSNTAKVAKVSVWETPDAKAVYIP